MERIFEVRGIVIESKDKTMLQSDDCTPLMRQHFIEREQAEERFFGEECKYGDFQQIDKLVLGMGSPNTTSVEKWIEEKKPQYLVLFGCSLIDEKLLKAYKGRVINLHLGLSPYYRGAATNFWALVNREPECVGATIHIATSAVDGGGVLGQIRPIIKEFDSCHDIGCKAIEQGITALIRCISRLSIGDIVAEDQIISGKVFKKSDFSHASILKLKKNFSKGMITEYLQRRSSLCQKFPIKEIF